MGEEGGGTGGDGRGGRRWGRERVVGEGEGGGGGRRWGRRWGRKEEVREEMVGEGGGGGGRGGAGVITSLAPPYFLHHVQSRLLLGASVYISWERGYVITPHTTNVTVKMDSCHGHKVTSNLAAWLQATQVVPNTILLLTSAVTFGLVRVMSIKYPWVVAIRD